MDEDCSELYQESPWRPRVNISSERDAMAKKCQSYSPLVSPWVVPQKQKIRNLKSDYDWKSDKMSFKSPVSKL